MTRKPSQLMIFYGREELRNNDRLRNKATTMKRSVGDPRESPKDGNTIVPLKV